MGNHFYSLPRRSLSYLRKHGWHQFVVATIDFSFPEPYATTVRGYFEVLQYAITSENPITDRIVAVRYGLTPMQYRSYCCNTDFEPSQYLNEIDRRKARHINEQPRLLDDKRDFYHYLREQGFEEYVPAVFGEITWEGFSSEMYGSLREVLNDHERIVLKKNTGGGGEYVWICQETTEAMSIIEKIEQDEVCIVQEYCKNAEYIASVYPRSANTIRILTCNNGEDVLFPSAVHRIGTHDTGKIDNFSQGGLAAAVYVNDGQLSPAVEMIHAGELIWHQEHPETGRRISGVHVPGWKTIKDDLINIAQTCTRFRYVGWDIIVTDRGSFKILEGNSYPDPYLFQVHEPLLAQDGLKEFYESHDVL